MKIFLIKTLSFILIAMMILASFVMPVAAEIEEVDDIGDLGGVYHFLCETDKDMLSYMPGDSVIFTVQLFSKNVKVTVPYLLYTVERDDGVKNSGRVEPDDEGNYIIAEYTMDIPGYVRLTIDFPDKNGNKNWSAITENKKCAFEGGVLVDIENIKPVNEMPEDYVEFWNNSLTLLDEYSPDPIEIKSAGETSSYAVYAVYINCYGDRNDLKSGDTFAAGYLNVPKNKKAGTLPIKMQFQGYGIYGAPKSTSADTIVLSMCAHSFKLGAESYDSDLFNLPLDASNNYGWSITENRMREEVYFRNMFLRNVQAARFLIKYFGNEDVERNVIDGVDTSEWKGLWDGEEFVASGGSQGGFQAFAMGALCPQVSLVRANVPWGGNQGAGTYTNPTSSVLGSTFAPPYAPGLDYHDSVFFATMLNCDVIITGGMGDMTCSPANLMMMYNSATRGKNINASITLQQGETHMFKPNPNMAKSTLAVYKNEVVDWNIEDGVLNVTANGVLNDSLVEVGEWNKKIADVKEINIFGNVISVEDNVFAIKNKTTVYLKSKNAVKISSEAFFGSRDAVLYLNEPTRLDGVAEPEGFELHFMGVLDQEEIFSYALDDNILKIYSYDSEKPLTTTSGDTALVNFMKDNAEKVTSIEIRGEFLSLGNMQPAFSKLTNVVDVKIDIRNTALSDEKNFMGLKSLVSLGHYDFAEDKAVTFETGTVNLAGFDTYIDGGGINCFPGYILSGCKAIEKVIMPEKLTCGDVDVAGVIGEKAFADCSSLKTVEFQYKTELTSLAFAVFSKCTSLDKVLIKGSVSEKFSCVLNISKLQSFAQVPDTAVFEVGTEEFAKIINEKFAEGELAIKAVSNNTYTPPADDNETDNNKTNNKNSAVKFDFDPTMIIIIAASAAVIVAVVIILVVLRPKKKK